MGVASQRIDLEQPAQVGHGLGSMSPARRSSSRRYRTVSTTPVTEKTAAFQVCSSGYGLAGFNGLLGKALTREATSRPRINIQVASWLHSMVPHGRLLFVVLPLFFVVLV